MCHLSIPSTGPPVFDFILPNSLSNNRVRVEAPNTVRTMSACVREDADALLKPIDLVNILRQELDLGPCYDLKPKQIVELANVKLAREPVEGATVKDECVALREAVRNLPPSFWSPDTIRSNSAPDELVARALAKPASAGGFCSAVACTILGPKAINTKTVAWGGALNVDGFSILRSPGAYCTTQQEAGKFVKLFKIDKTNEKLGDCQFHLQEKLSPAPGQQLMLMKSNKCNARLAVLYTPKWCLLAVYHFVDVESEAMSLTVLEELRVEAFAKRK